MEQLFFLKRGAYGRILWTEEVEEFMRNNYQKYSNPEMAKILGEEVTSVRTKMYKMGLLKMQLEYWTKEQHQFLVDNYKTMGDTEITEAMQKLFPKQKGWTKKHIEKRRRQKGLKRTRQEIDTIFLRNKQSGRYKECNTKMWAKRGVSKEGELRLWRNSKNGDRSKMWFIKKNGRFLPWARTVWEEKNGPVPEGYVVAFADFSKRDELDPVNLVLKKREEVAMGIVGRHSEILSDDYVKGLMKAWGGMTDEQIEAMPEMVELKRNILKLKREIKQKQNDERK
jgi:hypothetical protein